MAAPRKFPDELRERAVRLVEDVEQDAGSVTAACRRVGEQLGINADTLRNWVRQAQVDAGARPGVTTADAARIRRWSGRTPSCDGRTGSCGRRRVSSRQCHPECRSARFARFFAASQFDGLSSMCGRAGHPGRVECVA